MNIDIDEDVAAAFGHLWNKGYDGRLLAQAFVRQAAKITRQECAKDIELLHGELEQEKI